MKVLPAQLVAPAGMPPQEFIEWRVDRRFARRYRLPVESKLAHHAEQQLIEAARRLSPTQRLAAFVEHCRLVQELHRSANQVRESKHDCPSRESS